MGGITGHTVDSESWNYFQNVIENSNLLYRRVPEFEDKMLGLSKKYIDSETEIDKTMFDRCLSCDKTDTNQF